MTTVGCLLFAAALSAGNAEFERSAVAGAAEIAVARLKAEATALPCVTGVLERVMLEDPSRFATREAALRAGEAVYADAVSARLARDVDATLAHLAGTRSAEDAFGADFVRQARTLSAAERARVLTGPYPNVFARERRTACERQAGRLVAAVRPPMALVDGEDESKIRSALVSNLAAQNGRTVFEENLGYVSEKLVEPLVADAKREKLRQQKYVRSVRAEARTPSALRADLARKLAENVRERTEKTENAALRWEIFPSVTNKILDAAVEQRILAHLASRIAETPLGYDASSVRAVLAADPAVHYGAEASRAAFHVEASARLVRSARAAVLAEVGADVRKELEGYLAPRLGSSVVTKPVETRLTAELNPLLARVRQDASAQEFAKRYPRLKDGTWCPEPVLADRVAARSDFASAVRDWRKMPELSPFVVRAAFEETDACADRAVRSAFETARAAVAGQVKAVDEVRDDVLAEARARKESFFRRTPDLKAIVRLLTDATAARWSQRKVSVLWPETKPPANAAQQHAELFPSVKRRIELVAREIFEEMEKSETPPEETPPEEPKLEFSIVVSREGERVTVRLAESGKDIVSRETDAKLAPFRSAMKEVADKLGAEIMKLK